MFRSALTAMLVLVGVLGCATPGGSGQPDIGKDSKVTLTEYLHPSKRKGLEEITMVRCDRDGTGLGRRSLTAACLSELRGRGAAVGADLVLVEAASFPCDDCVAVRGIAFRYKPGFVPPKNTDPEGRQTILGRLCGKMIDCNDERGKRSRRPAR